MGLNPRLPSYWRTLYIYIYIYVCVCVCVKYTKGRGCSIIRDRFRSIYNEGFFSFLVKVRFFPHFYFLFNFLLLLYKF